MASEEPAPKRLLRLSAKALEAKEAAALLSADDSDDSDASDAKCRRRPQCEAAGCTTQPTYAEEGETRPRFCAAHGRERRLPRDHISGGMRRICGAMPRGAMPRAAAKQN